MVPLFARLAAFMRLYRERIHHFHPDVRRFLLGQFLVGLGMTGWGLFFNLFLQAQGFNKEHIGSTLAIGNLATAAFAIPAGLAVGRIPHRRLLFWSQIFNLSCLIMALFSSDTSHLWAALFFASGFGTAARIVAGPLIMSRSTPHERTYVFSVNFIVGYLGGILGNILGGTARRGLDALPFSEAAGYRIAILLGLLLCVAGAIPFLKIGPEPAEHKPQSALNLKSLRDVRWRFLLILTLPPTLISLGAGLIVQFMNLYFKDVFQMADQTIGILMSLQAATMALGVLAAPAMAERIGKVNTIVITEVLSLPFMVFMGITHSPAIAGFCFVIRAALMNMSGPVSSTLLLELCLPEERGIQNALQTFAWAISWAVAAWVYGHVLRGNYTFSFYLAAALYAVAALLYYRILHGLEPRPSETLTPKPSSPR